MFIDKSFEISGNSHRYWHKGGWAETERAVEVPLALEFLANAKSVLEVGNVTRQHDRTLEHMVIDLDEQHPDWENYENADVLTYTPTKKFSSVLSISTVEHTMDIRGAIKNIQSWAKNTLVTFPLGYNSPGGTRTGDLLNDDWKDITVMRRDGDPFEWFEISVAEAIEQGHEGLRCARAFKGATAIAIVRT